MGTQSTKDADSVPITLLYLINCPQSCDASGLLQGELLRVDVMISCDDFTHALVHLLQLRDTQRSLKETRRGELVANTVVAGGIKLIKEIHL